MDYTYFDKYLENNINLDNCISNHKNKVFVFKEKIETETFYIKKYIPYGKRKLRIAFGLLEDRANHYKKISEKLKKLNIPHVELEYSNIKKISFFDRTSIIVTKYAGETLDKYLDDIEKNKDLIRNYYDLFLKLIRNNIYPIDYNSGGFLINGKREVKLIDFDDYRLNSFLNQKLKNRLIRNLRRIYLEEKRSEKCEEFLKSEIERVTKELNWQINVRKGE